MYKRVRTVSRPIAPYIMQQWLNENGISVILAHGFVREQVHRVAGVTLATAPVVVGGAVAGLALRRDLPR